MGPLLVFNNNKGSKCGGQNTAPLIKLYGVQSTIIENNEFNNCNPHASLIVFEDAVRVDHRFRYNTIRGSGTIVINKYVIPEANIVQ
ncbi:MAG: hypothetical protein JNK14_16575 [Chitinophagaceae bacterium]|nr:hypothetical protein [Chitinophagaceae bacterium]